MGKYKSDDAYICPMGEGKFDDSFEWTKFEFINFISIIIAYELICSAWSYLVTGIPVGPIFSIVFGYPM